MEVEILRKITQLPGLEQAESKAGRPLSAYSCQMHGCNTFAGVNFSSRLEADLYQAKSFARNRPVADIH
jgi:hypothetical protein